MVPDRGIALWVVVSLGTGLASGQIAHDDAGGGPGGGPGGEFGWFVESNTEWRSQLELDELGDGATRASDCWGYVSGQGREYALIGLDSGFSFVEVTDPLRPSVVHFEPGPVSVWRDIKTFGSFAYGVSEAPIGIQVFDLGQIDAGVVSRVGEVKGNGPDSTHNVVIDTESGFLYRVGGGGDDSGVRMYDLNADPAVPEFVGQWTGDIYIHDAQAVTYTSGDYAGRQIVFACGGSGGGWTNPRLHILDVTDKANVFRVASVGYLGAQYAHQGWLSPDRRFFFLDDELDEAFNGHETRTRVFDVQDLAEPDYLGWFSNGNAAMDHNLYTREDLVYEANYRSGLRVFRAAPDPLDSVEVAWLDTFRLNDIPASDGVWSNYPFLPSRNIVLSDIQQGLIIARLTIDRVDISFPDGEPEWVDPRGTSVIRVRVEGRGLTPDLDGLALHFEAGGRQVVVAPSPTQDPAEFEFAIPPAMCGGEAAAWIEAPSVEGPVFTWPTRAPVERARLAVATEAAVPFDDDFQTDRGWTVSGDASSGRWELDVPIHNGLGDPPFDFDMSGACALTWNLDEDSDVDGGRTILTSPPIDASLGGTISYAVWLGSDPSDPLGAGDGVFVEVSIDGGVDWVPVAAFESASDEWRRELIDLDSHGLASEALLVRFIAVDAGADDLVEAAVDAVRYRGYGCGCLADLNGDGTVNTQDFLAFLGAWAGREPVADWNHDGRTDTLDFLAYLNDWVAGC